MADLALLELAANGMAWMLGRLRWSNRCGPRRHGCSLGSPVARDCRRGVWPGRGGQLFSSRSSSPWCKLRSALPESPIRPLLGIQV